MDLVESLFFRIFGNDLLRRKILGHLRTNWVSADVLVYLFENNNSVVHRWDDTTLTSNWIVENSYFYLFIDKLEKDKRFKATKDSVYKLLKKCQDINIIQRLHKHDHNLIKKTLKVNKYYESLNPGIYLLDEMCKKPKQRDIVKFLMSLNLFKFTTKSLKNSISNGPFDIQFIQFLYSHIKVISNKDKLDILELSLKYSNFEIIKFFKEQFNHIIIDINQQIEYILDNPNSKDILKHFQPWSDIKSHCLDRYAMNSQKFHEIEDILKEFGIPSHCTSTSIDNATCSNDLKFLKYLHQKFQIVGTKESFLNAISFGDYETLEYITQHNIYPEWEEELKINYKSLVFSPLGISNFSTCRFLLDRCLGYFTDEDKGKLEDSGYYDFFHIYMLCVGGDLELLQKLSDNQLVKVLVYPNRMFPSDIRKYLRKKLEIYWDPDITDTDKGVKLYDSHITLDIDPYNDYDSMMRYSENPPNKDMFMDLVNSHSDIIDKKFTQFLIKIMNLRGLSVDISFCDFKKLHQLSLKGALKFEFKGRDGQMRHVYTLSIAGMVFDIPILIELDRDTNPKEVLEYMLNPNYRFKNVLVLLHSNYFMHFSHEGDRESISKLAPDYKGELYPAMVLHMYYHNPNRFNCKSCEDLVQHLATLSDWQRAQELYEHYKNFKKLHRYYGLLQFTDIHFGPQYIGYILDNKIDISLSHQNVDCWYRTLFRHRKLKMLKQLSQYPYISKGEGLHNFILILQEISPRDWLYLLDHVIPQHEHNHIFIEKLKSFLHLNSSKLHKLYLKDKKHYQKHHNYANYFHIDIYNVQFRKDLITMIVQNLIKSFDETIDWNSLNHHWNDNGKIDIQYKDIFKLEVSIDSPYKSGSNCITFENLKEKITTHTMINLIIEYNDRDIVTENKIEEFLLKLGISYQPHEMKNSDGTLTDLYFMNDKFQDLIITNILETLNKQLL
ncbi:hypothetical protein DLAC_08921 [Tieghemostelium lacteum]|uniref:Uncharacterized protein n=1 Tax=Tieghemostelium lacteum TaxID=361077 RepID=A0A151Z8Q6_TIELA|nr:hypothetical protein DLAC_08921 [Tieghemostelium lacteum]|eukprot:KYQ90317.1 hypothetical protein DLAC_08921 [Tieghemostelium lacteum]